MKKQRLSDAYRFPGFIPEREIQTKRADDGARVIRMKRCQKKQFVRFADEVTVLITTVRNDESATCLAASFGYFLSLSCAGLNVRSVTW
jgi:hypothetical protein